MTLKHKMLVDPPASVETAVQYAERYVAARDCMSKQKPVRMVRPADDELDSDDESSDSAEFQLDGIKFVRKGAPSQRKTKRESTPLRNRGTSGKTDKAFDIEKIKCYNCGGMGHFKSSCPSPPLNLNVSSSSGEKKTQENTKSESA